MQEEFAVGRVLSRGFGIWFKNLPSFLLITAVAFIPVVAFNFYAHSGEITVERIAIMGGLSALLAAGLGLIVTGAVLYGVIKQLRGEHAGIGECVAVGLKRMFPILGVGIVSFLPVVAALGLAIVTSPLLILLFIIPILIYYLMIYVAVPASVIERPGIMGAIKRSFHLTSGYKGQIFGLLLVLGVLNWVVDFIAKRPFMAEGMFKTLEDYKTYTWIALGIQVLYTSLSATITGVVYHDLRVAKEGVATEDLAKVFE